MQLLAQSPSRTIMVNAGGSNRSSVTNFVVVPPDEFRLAPKGGSLLRLAGAQSFAVSNILTEELSVSNSVRLSFPSFPGGTLPDGNYLASAVVIPKTNMAGPRTNETALFHRFFGDHDGDRDVDFFDSFWFRNTWKAERETSRFDPSLDLDGDGLIDTPELVAFNRNYFSILPQVPAIFAHLVWDDGVDFSDSITTRPEMAGRVMPSPAGLQVRGVVQEVDQPSAPLSHDLSAEVASDGTFRLSAGRLAQLAGGRLLPEKSYLLRLGLEDVQQTLVATYEVAFTVANDCPLAQQSWVFDASAVPEAAGRSPGRAVFDGCSILLAEGDSFAVMARRSFAVPSAPGLLSITYQTPVFDGLSTNRIKDAFEVAVLDSGGRPILPGIQGSQAPLFGATAASRVLPANPDVVFNHTDGETPFSAPGAILQLNQAGPGIHTVLINLTTLPAASQAQIQLRLLNNDEDRNGRVRITDVAFKPFDPALNLVGSPGMAFSLLVGPRPLLVPPATLTPNALCDGSALLLDGFNSRSTATTAGVANAAGLRAPDLTVEAPGPGQRLATGLAMVQGQAKASGQVTVGVVTNSTDLVFDGFARVENLRINGTARVVPTADGQVMRLTAAQPFQAGAIFSQQRLRAASFSTYFRFRISAAGGLVFDPGADGLALVIQPVTSSLGTSGQGIGYGGIRPSVAVEFDTYQNGDNNDPDSNHVGITLNGDSNHGPGAPFTVGIPERLDDGAMHHAWVDYDGSRMEVRLARTANRPSAPNLTRQVNLRQVLGSNEAFLGFTSATGSSWGDHDLLYWEYRQTFDPIGLTQPNTIMAVTVNGSPVEALDRAGNFFSPVQVNSGRNRLEVVATDNLGLSTTNSLDLFGTSCPEETRTVGPLPTSILPFYERTSFREDTRILYADVHLRNQSSSSFTGPLYVGVRNISDLTVQPLAPDGVSADGIPYYDFSSALEEGRLGPLQSSLPRTIAFRNPGRRQFTFELVAYGPINRAPAFTTLPVLEAVVGRPYLYALNAQDPDGDTVSYRTLTSPQGMTLDAGAATLRLQPTTTQIGTHEVRLLADDGRGGRTEQRFLLSVTLPPSNRPPVFVSRPVTVARASDIQSTNSQTFDLSKWSVVQLQQRTSLQGSANWVLSASNTVAIQTVNADASILLSDTVIENEEVSGTWRMGADPDDDHVGFVFGYQDRRRFYLFDWKQADQADRCGEALRGMSVKRLSGDSELECEDLWPSVQDNARVKTLFRNSIPWQRDRDYRFTLRHRPGSFTITIADGANTLESVTIEDATYPKGAFGFYNYSQGNVSYRGFARQALREITYVYDTDAVDPDGDPLTYTLPTAPAGMGIDPVSGLIRWGPAPTQIGSHPVTVSVSDGRGGTAVQNFLVCVLEVQGNRPPLFVSLPPPIKCYQRPPVAGAMSVLVPWLFDGYRYRIVQANALPGFERVDYDDGAFNFGGGGFGTAGWCALNTPETMRTYWPVNTDLLIRRWVDLPDGTLSLGIKVAIDNEIQMFVNGVDVSGGRRNGGGCALRQNFVFDVPSTVFRAGSNLIAARAIDLGPSQSYFDMEVTADLGPILFGHVAQALDPDGDPVRYRLGVAPAGATVSSDGRVRWDVSRVALGRHQIEIIAEDGRGGRTSQVVALEVQEQCQPGIRGMVWNDLNENEVRDSGPGAGEPPLSGRIVYVDLNQNLQRDLGEPFEVTGPSGEFTFSGLAPGTYSLRMEPWRDWLQSFPKGGGSVPVRVISGEVADVLGFGVVQRTIASEANAVPTFLSAAPSRAVVGAALQYPTLVRDPDGDQLEFDLVVHPEGMIVDAGTGVLAWAPELNQIGAHEVILRARDGRGGVALQSFSLEVEPANTPPLLISALPAVAVINRPYTLQLQAQDAENQALRFGVTNGPVGLQVNLTNGIFTWTPALAQVGTNRMEILVTDSDGAVSRTPASVVVVPSVVNLSPEFVTSPRTQIRLDTPYVYPVQASDANADPVSLALVQGPAGMQLTNRWTSPVGDTQAAPFNGAFLVWRPGPGQIGQHPVTLRASDGRGGMVEQRFDLRVGSTLTNAAPLIVSQPPVGASSESLYAYDPEATDADGDAVTWRLVEGPAGASINGQSGALRWIPTYDQMGTNVFVVEARDPFEGVDRQSFTVMVGCGNDSPQITSTPPTWASVGEVYLYAPRATDPEADALSWTLVSRPTGMTVDERTGLVRWTPATNQTGGHLVQVRVADGRGGFDTQTYTVQVNNQRGNQPPLITSTPQLGIGVGRAYAYDLRAVDPDGDTVRLELLARPADAAFTLGSTTGGSAQATVSWTPSQAGTFEFVAAATDSRGASAAQRFLVEVRVNQPPRITSSPRTNATPGAVYRYDVLANDPDGDRLVYALGPAPAGMTISPLGQLVWTPDTNNEGPYMVGVLVSDGFGGEARQQFAVTVAPDDEAPSVSLAVGYNVLDGTGARAVRIGSAVPITVSARDNVGVLGQALTVAGQAQALAGTGTALVTFPATPGFVEAVGEARDAAGNVGVARERILVVDPSQPGGGGGSMGIVIHSPTNSAFVTRKAEVVVSINSVTPLAQYTVEYAELISEVAGLEVPVDDPRLQYQVITNGVFPPGVTTVNRAVLANFDPTILPNGGYLIRVTAFDQSGQGRQEGTSVEVTGNLKFGEFRIAFNDLQIPLAGIPITVQRVYDSRDRNRRGDFGHGWSLGLADARILETGKKWGAGFDDTTLSIRSRVYLTGPDGRRVGFSLAPRFRSGGFFGIANYDMVFQADPGVYDTLETDDPGGYSVLRDGSIGVALFGGILGFDPDTYRLRTRDGLVYHYQQPGGLRRVEDRNGNFLTYERDGIRHSQGQRIEFRRDSFGRIQQIVGPDGIVLLYDYDAAGDLRSFTDQVTNVTRYTYNAARPHFLTNIIDSLGRNALNLVYDDTGRLTEVRDALGNPVRQDFDLDANTGTLTDARGNQTIVHFDDQGNETLRIVPGISTNRFAYDQNNNLTNAVNARGYTTNFTYDVRGNLTTITDSLTNTTRITYNAVNEPLEMVNALGQRLNLRYDGNGQLLEVVDNAGNRTAMAQDASGRMTSLTDATGKSTRFEYESGCACSSPGKVINPDGSFRLYGYNSLGQTNRVVNELGAETRLGYDAAGRLLWVEDALNRRTSFRYEGVQLAAMTDALGRETRYAYDNAGRTNRITDAEGGVIRLEYDANGNQTSITDPVGNVTRFVHDAANRLIQQIDPLGNTNLFAYDPAGNQTEAIDRNGRRRTFAYDALNRMTNEVWWEGTNAVRSIAFGFSGLGAQTLAEDPAARYEYRYDGLNRLEQVTARSAGVPDFTLRYAYTALGQVESVIDHWGVRVSSAYDSRGHLATRTWSSTLPSSGVDPARVDFSYDASGARMRTDRFADLSGANRIGFTTNAYNRVGIVTNITHLSPASQVLAKYEYDLDPAYQIRKWAINGQLSEFGHDRTGQLTNALNSAQPNENFRYDANGNRVGPQTGGSFLAGRNNQILSDGTNNYAYDREGNMTSRSNTLTSAVTTYQWDHRNRLVTVLDRNPAGVVTQTVSFVYDAMNRRLAKTVNGQTTRFLYNGDDSWADLDAGNAVTARYLHGSRVDELLARQHASDGRGWYLTDHLGTVRSVVDGEGARAAHVDYSVYGEAIENPTSGALGRFLYAGREYDEGVGLHFFRERYYSSRMGRFINEDPIGFLSGEMNIYRYVLNAPTMATDPFGLTLVEYSLLSGKDNANKPVVACSGMRYAVVLLIITLKISVCTLPPSREVVIRNPGGIPAPNAELFNLILSMIDELYGATGITCGRPSRSTPSPPGMRPNPGANPQRDIRRRPDQSRRCEQHFPFRRGGL